MPAEQPHLIDGAAEGRTEARNRPPGRRKRSKPAQEQLELVQRDVVQECISAVEIARDAACFDVPRDSLGGIEVKAAAGVVLPRQRRHGEHPREMRRGNRRGCG
jgi:hypothetical protein